MSYDLALWSNAPRKLKNAKHVYERLCEGDTSLVEPELDAAQAVQGFLAELTARYPTSDTLSDNRIDEWAWSSDPEATDVSVILMMPHSRAEEIEAFVLKLADKYNLMVYNPQTDLMWLPPPPPGRSDRPTGFMASLQRVFRSHRTDTP